MLDVSTIRIAVKKMPGRDIGLEQVLASYHSLSPASFDRDLAKLPVTLDISLAFSFA
jgi:hypothetical protein